MFAATAQYLGYHQNFDCECGFDVPMTVLERRHHRSRQRSDVKPGVHGAKLPQRRPGNCRLLQRSHSLPDVEEQEQEEQVSGREARSDLTVAAVAKVKSKSAPAMCLSESLAGAGTGAAEVEQRQPQEGLAPRGADVETDMPGEAGGPEGPGAAAAAAEAPLAQRPASEAAPGAAGAEEERGARSFADCVASASPTARMPHQWRRAPKAGGEGQLEKPQPSTKEEPEGPPRHTGTEERVLERQQGYLVEPDVAEAAVRLLPKVLTRFFRKGAERVSLRHLKLMLEYAVGVCARRPERGQHVEALHNKSILATFGGSLDRPGDLEVLQDFSEAQRRDMRMRGWLQGHSGSQGFKASEAVAQKAVQRLEQSRRDRGLPIAIEEGKLEESWKKYDKVKSKQHGGGGFKRWKNWAF